MLDPVFSAVEKLVTEFSWKRVVYVLLMALLGLAVFTVFEWYTAHFRLARLEKSAEILQTLMEIEGKGVAANAELAKLHQDLSRELRESSYPRRMGMPEIRPLPVPRRAWLAKFFAGGFLLWLLVLRVPFELRNDSREEKLNAAGGMVFLGTITGGVGMLIPSIFWPWVNMILYPIVSFLMVALVAVITSDSDETPSASSA